MWYLEAVTDLTSVPQLCYISDDVEYPEETLEIMEDAELMDSLARSRQEATDGKLYLLSVYL